MLSDRTKGLRPLISLGIVILAWLVIPGFAKRFTQNLFYEFQAPALNMASYVRDLQTWWGMRLKPRSELIEGGRDLARINAAQSIQIQQMEALKDEVNRLEQLFDLPSLPLYETEIARVSQRDLNGWWQTLTLRKGNNFDIKEGSPVIFAEGVVGKVIQVNTFSSRVQLITSPDFRIAAVFEGDQRPVRYQGLNVKPFGVPTGIVMNVPTDIDVSPNQPLRLVTSGLGGVFPAGLTIGWVYRLEASSDGLFQSGEVILSEDLRILREVSVLQAVSPEGTE